MKNNLFGIRRSRFGEIRQNTLIIRSSANSDEIIRKIVITPQTKVEEIVGKKAHSIVIQNEGEDRVEFSAETEELINAWVLELETARINNPSLSMEMFTIRSVIGKGFYGKVMLAENKQTKKLYAIKSVHKSRLIQTGKVRTVFSERDILIRISHPFIVSLSFAFQSDSKIYLGLEYVPGGDLCRYLALKKTLDIAEVRLFIAEIGLALEHLHSSGIIYRDLKPENILIDAQGHLKLTDFGLSKEISSQNSTSTFCGTAEYLAPEVLSRTPYTFMVDWWSLGILTYELLFGATPFSDPNQSRQLQLILEKEPNFSDGTDPVIIDFISRLLQKNPQKRATFDSLNTHPFWNGISFDDVLKKKIAPIYVPEIKDERVPTNFDSQFTQETPVDSLATPRSTDDSEFNGFSFTRSVDGENSKGDEQNKDDDFDLPPIPDLTKD